MSSTLEQPAVNGHRSFIGAAIDGTATVAAAVAGTRRQRQARRRFDGRPARGRLRVLAQLVLTVSGWTLLSAGAYVAYGLGAGLAAGGVSALILEWQYTDAG